MDDMLQISPLELKFRFELRKQIPTSLRLHNPTDGHVAFKVKTTSPKKYCVRPNTGTVAPNATTEVTVIMQMQKDLPPNPSQCKDKFLVQSMPIGPEAPPENPSPEFLAELFTNGKANGLQITETKLKVSYVMPNNPPSPVPEDREAEVEELAHFPVADPSPVRDPSPGSSVDSKYENAMANLALATNERNAAAQEASRLRKELDRLTVQVKDLETKSPAIQSVRSSAPPGTNRASKVSGLVAGFTLIHILITAILAFLLGRYT